MNKQQLQKFETVLHRACKKHVANGGSIIRGRFWDPTDHYTACPIRAVVMPLPAKGILQQLWYLLLSLFGRRMVKTTFLPGSLNEPYADAVARVLGFSFSQMDLCCFSRGFDQKDVGYNVPQDEENKAVFRLGQKFAELYQPREVE
jgi:hypothetical protein